jgi:hypothetical protein
MNACIKVQCFKCSSAFIRYPDQLWDYFDLIKIYRFFVIGSVTVAIFHLMRGLIIKYSYLINYMQNVNVKLMPPYVRDKSLKKKRKDIRARLLEQSNHQTLVIA